MQIDAVSGLRRLLSANGPTAIADLGAQLASVCGALRSAVSTDIVIAEDLAPQCRLPINQVLPVTQIVTELITNAIKYGRMPGGPGAIRVSCRMEGADGIVIEVADRGRGKTDEKLELASRGLGSRLVQSLTQQIGGSIMYLPGHPGLTVRMTLNVAAPKPASATFEMPETSAPR